MTSSKQSVKEVFDSIAKNWSWEELYTKEMNRLSYNFISRQLAVEKLLDARGVLGRAIDVGCGTGSLASFFVGKGVEYTGLDISPEMIERANNKYQHEVRAGKVNFIMGDSENLPFEDNYFDVVAAVALIEYFPDPSGVLNEMTRVLKPGGIIIVTVPHKSAVNFKIRDMIAPFRNIFFPWYAKLSKASLAEMKNVKHYHYDPEEIDDLMHSRSLLKEGERFTNFYVIPHPLDHIVPSLYIRLSELLGSYQKSYRFKKLAVNYIGLYIKKQSE